MVSKCVCIGEGGGVTALQHWSCVYRRWDMGGDSSAIDTQTEMDILCLGHCGTGCRKVGFVVSHGVTEAPRG